MTGLLNPSLPLGLGETPASYVSRLARLHRVATGSQLSIELGIPYSRLMAGEAHALERLANVTGSRFEDLAAGAFHKELDGCSLRGQRLVPSSLSLASIRACPECLLADLAGPAGDLGAYGRATWKVSSIRTCPIHCTPVIEVAREVTAARMHDFAAIVGPELSTLGNRLAGQPRREPSTLETYLLRRLEGHAGGARWLDRLPFYVAARTCEVVGSAAVFGISRTATVEADADLHLAGGAGFDILSGGERSFAEFLDSARNEEFETYRKPSRIPSYGKFGAWLQSIEHDDFRLVKDVVRSHIVRTSAVGPGDVVLGQEVTRRRLHSVYSAARETGAHPKRLRKLLDGAGLLQAHAGLSDSRILFDADAAREVLEVAASHLSFPGMAARLGLTNVQARSLLTAGVVVPFARGGNGLGTSAFSKVAVDDLLARLFAGAVPLDDAEKAGRLVEPVPHSFKRAHCSLAEVVALILERKLGWVAVGGDGATIADLYVDVMEVREHVRGRELTGATFVEAQLRLRRSHQVVKALVDNGILTTRMSVHPNTRVSIRVIDRGDIERFRQEYVTLFDLARERGEHHLKIKAELDEAGIRPPLRREDFGAAFYRKSTLPW